MREILFKAKSVYDGEWVEGYYIRDQYHIGGKDIIFYRKDSDRFTVYTNIIDIETLCQFTGLCDKNGNKIWENDIFQYTDETMVAQRDLIEYNETHASFVRLHNTEKLGLQYLWIDEATCNHGEVIGNIFDNKELLQEESDE
jgi:uncharacterized phage protein (TIGR01671 family)|nr:MAG TPA: YopX protein [Caudoviricetes sp.]